MQGASKSMPEAGYLTQTTHTALKSVPSAKWPPLLAVTSAVPFKGPPVNVRPPRFSAALSRTRLSTRSKLTRSPGGGRLPGYSPAFCIAQLLPARFPADCRRA